MKSGIELIAEERQRQIEVEKWDYSHDADYKNGQLVGAALCYAANALNKQHGHGFAKAEVYTADFNDPEDDASWKDAWPWSDEWDKRNKHDRVRSLVIAGALIAAELDRLNASDEAVS